MRRPTRPRLSYLLAQDGRSTEELAAAAGLGEATIRGILRSRRQPSLPTLERLADALSVPVSELLEAVRDCRREVAK